jgi:ABC-2 type transport system ATP-binding protein
MMIEFEQVSKSYGPTRALDGVDLAVHEGAVLGLIGPNGAGKSTSMLIMSTLLDRDAGKVRVAGVDPAERPGEVRRLLGYMPDFFGFYDSLSASEYLEFFAAASGVPSGRRPSIVADLLALVDLEHKADADVNALSRGMKQRLSLARALVHDPALLVLDEPASGLDPRARVHLRELIAELARMGKTIVISSHILSELEGICSHMAVVDGGRVVAEGDIAHIRASFAGAVRVIARVPDDAIDLAHDHLAGLPAATEVGVERGMLRFALSGDETTSAAVLAGVIGAGIPVIEWRVEAAGLEELFLRLTREDEGA